MADPAYTMYADEPFYKKVPWWGWVLGFGLLFVVMRRRRHHRDYQDYLA